MEEKPDDPTAFGVPVSVFVKGGTSTWRNDQQVAADEADAELRRDHAAMERQLASVPIEHGGAKLYTNRLTESPEIAQAYALLDFVNSKGEPIYEHGEKLQCLADVLMVTPTELMLVLVCPSCKERGRPQGQAQVKIRQSNRRWHLDTSTAGQMLPWKEWDPIGRQTVVRFYRSAGTIMESERFTCDCGWSARIDKNRIWAA